MLSENELGTAEDFGDSILDQNTETSIGADDHSVGHDLIVRRQPLQSLTIFNSTRLRSLLINALL